MSSAGTVSHGDSLGNHGQMGAGDVQWMTAGRGILHQEMPQGDPQGRMHGFQLWANLPASQKMTAPRYQDIVSSDIPAVTDDDGTSARIICGSFWGKRGPVEGIATDPRYLDISVPPGKRKTLPVEITNHAFALCSRGPAGSAMHLTRARSNRCGWAKGHLSARRNREPLASTVRQRRRGGGPGRRSRYPISSSLRSAVARTRRLARPDRHEYQRGNPASFRRASRGHLHQRSVNV